MARRPSIGRSDFWTISYGTSTTDSTENRRYAWKSGKAITDRRFAASRLGHFRRCNQPRCTSARIPAPCKANLPLPKERCSISLKSAIAELHSLFDLSKPLNWLAA